MGHKMVCHGLEAQQAQKRHRLQEVGAMVQDHREACLTLEAQLTEDLYKQQEEEAQLACPPPNQAGPACLTTLGP